MSANQAKLNTVVMPQPTETEVREQYTSEEACSFPVHGNYETNTILGVDCDSDTETIYFTDEEGQEFDHYSNSDSPGIEQDIVIDRNSTRSQECLTENDTLEGQDSVNIDGPTEEQEGETFSGQSHDPSTHDEDLDTIIQDTISKLIDRSLLGPGDVVKVIIIEVETKRVLWPRMQTPGNTPGT